MSGQHRRRRGYGDLVVISAGTVLAGVLLTFVTILASHPEGEPWSTSSTSVATSTEDSGSKSADARAPVILPSVAPALTTGSFITTTAVPGSRPIARPSIALRSTGTNELARRATTGFTVATPLPSGWANPPDEAYPAPTALACDPGDAPPGVWVICPNP